MMEAKGIRVEENKTVVEVTRGMLRCEDGTEQPFDECLWCTQAAAAQWLSQLDWETRNGFLAVNEFLQSPSHGNVFGAGDCVESLTDPRPKAGVFAVRQGPALAENLRLKLLGQPMKAFHPQVTATRFKIDVGPVSESLPRGVRAGPDFDSCEYDPSALFAVTFDGSVWC